MVWWIHVKAQREVELRSKTHASTIWGDRTSNFQRCQRDESWSSEKKKEQMHHPYHCGNFKRWTLVPTHSLCETAQYVRSSSNLEWGQHSPKETELISEKFVTSEEPVNTETLTSAHSQEEWTLWWTRLGPCELLETEWHLSGTLWKKGNVTKLIQTCMTVLEEWHHHAEKIHDLEEEQDRHFLVQLQKERTIFCGEKFVGQLWNWDRNSFTDSFRAAVSMFVMRLLRHCDQEERDSGGAMQGNSWRKQQDEVRVLQTLFTNQGHTGGNMVSPELMGYVKIPYDWKEFLFQVVCFYNMSPTPDKGLTAGGNEKKGGRYTIFFTPLNPFGENPDKRARGESLTVSRKLHCRNSWKNIKIQCMDKTFSCTRSRFTILANWVQCNCGRRSCARRMHPQSYISTRRTSLVRENANSET